MSKLMIVQPWFTAVGHPAQSILNTANALKGATHISYLVSAQPGCSEDPLNTLRRTVKEVETFKVNSASLREGTLKALFALCKLKRKSHDFTHVFFFDAHLVLLSALWFLFNSFLKPQRLSLIYLMGPERIRRSRIASYFVTQLLKRKEVTLYLRTEELMTAWHNAFVQTPPMAIRHLPSLELPDPMLPIISPAISHRLKFGILGQIRKGKGLEWLVPMFTNQPDLGELTVAGTFNNPTDEQAMAFLKQYGGFNNAYLTDDTLLQTALQQHYLLMMYDDWDTRMESAVLYLAARVGRPVLAYGKGWCGRQIDKYGNGIIVSSNHELPSLIKSLPYPGSDEYSTLLQGVERFRQAHSIARLQEQYLNELTRNVSR